MLHGVGDQFRKHQRQRRGVLRRHHAELADEVDVDVLVAHGGQIDGHLQQAGNDLVIVHDLVGGLAQALVHHGDGLHTKLGLLQLFLDLFGLGLACLQPEQRGNRLQIVLHTMMDFGDGRILGLQLLLTATQFGDVTAKHDTATASIGIHQWQ